MEADLDKQMVRLGLAAGFPAGLHAEFATDCFDVLSELLPEGWRVLRDPLCWHVLPELLDQICFSGMLHGCMLGLILNNGVPQGGILFLFLTFFDWSQADGSLVAITAEMDSSWARMHRL